MECSKLEQHPRLMIGYFVQICRRGLKVKADKGKMMMLGVEEGPVFKVYLRV